MDEEEIIQTSLLSYHNRENLYIYEDIYAKEQTYKDLDLRFIAHPLTGSVYPIEDVAAVKRALYNLVLTETCERPFNMEFGTPIGGLLFNLHPYNILDLKDQIKRSIQLFEPRVLIRDIKINNIPDRNLIEISIYFSVLNLKPDEVFEVRLTRTR